MRVGPDPAMVMDCRVERLPGVADEMAHHAHDINDVLLGVGDFIRRAAVSSKALR